MREKRVLIVRLSSLGDIIFNLPLANVLKRNGYKVTWVVSEKGYEVLKNNPDVDEVILAPLAKWKLLPFNKSFSEYIRKIKYLRSCKFDIAIDTQGLFKSFIWTAFSGAKRRITSISAREFSFLGANEFVEPLSKGFKTHAIYNYLKFAKHLNLNIDSIEVSLPSTSQETSQKVDYLLRNLDRSKPLVVVSPSTTWRAKHWDKENWRALIKVLEKDYNLVFTGNRSDIRLINYISGARHTNLAGETSLVELIEVFRRSDLVISLDSGSTHLAWATKKPKIVSIFCCTPISLYAPIGNPNKYIALSGNLPCQPCHKRRCSSTINKEACTKEPSVEDVLLSVRKLLPMKEDSNAF